MNHLCGNTKMVVNSLSEQNLLNRLFNVGPHNFETLALDVFHFQYQHNLIYQAFCKCLNANPKNITRLDQIPFLPISFFKSHSISTTSFTPQIIFESSGTTGNVPSCHLVNDLHIYRESFLKSFSKFYGHPSSYCIIGLLPSYLERESSSLVFMVNELLKLSGHPKSNFYLYDVEALHGCLLQLEAAGQPTLIFGVTYALIDFAKHFPMQLTHTVIIETGGMKGRSQELTRAEVHSILTVQLGLTKIHSEYGMTELMSQAYSLGDGIFESPPWMKVLLRATDDPFDLSVTNGAVNIIDLANIYSCAFIATDDTGILRTDSRFEITGRLDNSDIRGCSLMAP